MNVINSYFCHSIPTILYIKMKNRFRILFLFIIPCLFVSCETDFNVIADYKEVAIVYGLLNQNDSIHYLRINKAFLGAGNSLTYAQVADSSSYGADINVVLTEITSGGIIKERVFDTVSLYNKESGAFYSPKQLFYFYKDPLNDPFKASSTFELKITNKKTGTVVSSRTTLIHDFVITKPTAGAKTLNLRRSITQQTKFTWQNAVNAKKYQFRFYFNFKELNSQGDTTTRKIEWVFPEKTTENIDGIGECSVPYYNEDFYIMCTNKIPYSDQSVEDAVVKRIASSCDLEVTAIGDEFNTYLEANGPSTGVLMEKPDYSNIINGLGLFSSRYEMRRQPSIVLSPETILDLSTTTELKFAKPN